MELSTAITLIKNGFPPSPTPQTWADLGAGSGLFTRAMSSLLAEGSTIYAIDREIGQLNGIELDSPTIILNRIALDFIRDPIVVNPLDGILMANAFHFVQDKIAFISKIMPMIKMPARIVIVEYDSDSANQWVPFPISYRSLHQCADDFGITSITKIGSTPSKYHGNIYSALLTIG
jgi:hypothetical protein